MRTVNKGLELLKLEDLKLIILKKKGLETTFELKLFVIY